MLKHLLSPQHAKCSDRHGVLQLLDLETLRTLELWKILSGGLVEPLLLAILSRYQRTLTPQLGTHSCLFIVKNYIQTHGSHGSPSPSSQWLQVYVINDEQLMATIPRYAGNEHRGEVAKYFITSS